MRSIAVAMKYVTNQARPGGEIHLDLIDEIESSELTDKSTDMQRELAECSDNLTRALRAKGVFSVSALPTTCVPMPSPTRT